MENERDRETALKLMAGIPGLSLHPEDVLACVIKAITSERERAAKIAEDEDGHFSQWGEDRNTRVARQTCIDIAAAIRK